MSSNPGGSSPDLTGISAEEFVGLVSSASDEQLAEAMSGPQREPALREIFSRMAEHFDPAKAEGQDAVVHFQIPGRPDGGYDEFEVIVREGKCAVTETPKEKPRVTLKAEPVAFLKLITNQQSGPELFMAGKLKLEGDLMFAAQIPSFFQFPTAPNQGGSN